MCVSSFVPNRIELDMNFIYLVTHSFKQKHLRGIFLNVCILYFSIPFTYFLAGGGEEKHLRGGQTGQARLAHLVTVATLVGCANLTISLNMQINWKVVFLIESA